MKKILIFKRLGLISVSSRWKRAIDATCIYVIPAVVGAVVLTSVTTAPVFAQALTKIASFKDWTAYVHNKPNGKICFVISKPTDMEPKNVNRDSVFFYVTTWPKDNVANEISIKIGYPFKPDSRPFVAVGADRFRLVPRADKAFVADAKIEKKLVDSMRKGSKMIIKGRSRRGTLTTDTYSLSGISAALKKISEVCN